MSRLSVGLGQDPRQDLFMGTTTEITGISRTLVSTVEVSTFALK